MEMRAAGNSKTFRTNVQRRKRNGWRLTTRITLAS